MKARGTIRVDRHLILFVPQAMWDLSQGLRRSLMFGYGDWSGTIGTTRNFVMIGIWIGLKRFEQSEAVERLERLELATG
jgi:hypothetical protein